jgi:two-component system sensor histidine kinase/response regulator
MGGSKATILTVDDDPVLLSSVADILRLAGYSTLTATNGVEALQVMQQHVPDLIVADIMMPEMDGYELFEAVRENQDWISIPFIFLSAKGEQKDIRKGYDLGADHYLSKPFESEDLLVAIEARLKRIAEIQAVGQREVERAKERLMTIFGYELLKPLGRIFGYVSMLETGYGAMDDYVVAKMLHDTRLGTEYLVRMIEDLMLLVSIDNGLTAVEIERYREPVVVSSKIDSAVGQLQHLAEKRNIEISTTYDENLVVTGVPHHIEDIIMRLLDNAIKFGKPGGHVWITAQKVGNEGIVSVRDDGVGIPPDEQKRLFQRFEQIGRDQIGQQGVGLGLAIAEQLIQLHGGDIQVESQPGEGSTFTFSLPM